MRRRDVLGVCLGVIVLFTSLQLLADGESALYGQDYSTPSFLNELDAYCFHGGAQGNEATEPGIWFLFFVHGFKSRHKCIKYRVHANISCFQKYIRENEYRC